MKPILEVTLQPQRVFRFRYEDESSTHGVLHAGQLMEYNSLYFPTVTLKVAEDGDNIDYYIMVNLCRSNHSNKSKSHVEIPELSPYCLAQKTRKRKVDGKGNYEIFDQPIQEKMLRKSAGVYEYSLQNFFIICKKNKNDSLINKYEKLKAFCTTHGSESAIDSLIHKIKNRPEAQRSMEEVCLGFSVYMKHENHFKPLILSELSNPIRNGDPLRIMKLCNTVGKVNKETDVTVLVSGITKKDIDIHITEELTENQDPSQLWTRKFKCNKSDIHKSAAISFKMPKYEGPSKNSKINCNVTLLSDGVESNAVKFTYIADTKSDLTIFYDSADKTKENFSYEFDSIHDTKDINKGELSNENMLKTLKISDRDNREFIFELFYSIETDKFSRLYNKIYKNNLQAQVQSAKWNGESILLFACRLKKSSNIRALIGMGCKLTEVDNDSRTPFHWIIDGQDEDCLDILEYLIRHPDDYEHFKHDFKEVLNIFDNDGYTILHRAVLNDQISLVEAMLNFCENHEIPVENYRTHNAGNTIMHLAAYQRREKMAKLILTHYPLALEYVNYADKALIDDDFILRKLKIEPN